MSRLSELGAAAIGRVVLVCLVAWTVASSAIALGPVLIFGDGFESGNTLAWTSSLGEPPLLPADSFRVSDLDLRDPHVFVSLPGLGCLDFTDQPLPFGIAPALNQQIETAITTDGGADGDLDLSSLLLLRPWDADAVGARFDTAPGDCPAPFPPATCAVATGSLPQTTTYSAFDADPCLEAIGGTTSGYSPAVAAVSGSCFVSAGRPLAMDLGGILVPLEAVSWAAVPLGEPPSGFTAGLMRGFLSEATANATPIPPDIPIVGGQPVSVLLPGGTGNCAAGDDRDLHEGISGWWFYFAWTADAVTLTP